MKKSAAECLAAEPRSSGEADCCCCGAGVQLLVEDFAREIESCGKLLRIAILSDSSATPLTWPRACITPGSTRSRSRRCTRPGTCLIGGGCDALIPAQPPKEAIEARRRRANDTDHYHSIANPAMGEPTGERGLSNRGYRPGRKSAMRKKQKEKRE
jgi:hypothetical protein